MDPFWLGVLVTLAVEGAFFVFVVLALVVWLVLVGKSGG